MNTLFTDHGVAPLFKQDEEQHGGNCPFCGGKQKFHYGPKKLLWDCKVCCPEGGNASQFLQRVYDEVYAEDERMLLLLSRKKKLPIDWLRRAGVRWGNAQCVLPAFSGERLEKLCTLHHSLNSKPRVTSGTEQGLFRPVGTDPMTQTAWIAEGWSDFVTMLGSTDESVYGMPGAGVLPERCCAIFHGRDVIYLGDNDDAGRKGASLVTKRLKGKARSIRVLKWPPSAKDKEDVRDLFNKYGAETLSVIEKRLGDAPEVKQNEKSDPRVAWTSSFKLIKLCESEGIKTSRGFDGEVYARYSNNQQMHVARIQSAAFGNFLRVKYYEEYNATIGTQSIAEVTDLLGAQATEQRAVFQRYAEHEGEIWVNLGDGRYVRATPKGWTIEKVSPVWFYQSKGSKPLPTPVRGGSAQELFDLINVPRLQQSLVLSWLVAAMRPRGPYPILSLQGEQGSAKTTTARILRSLIDPSTPEQRSLPREESELITTAKNQHALAFDNVSGVPVPISDALCRMATGSGQSKRKLYSDDDEVLFQGARPIILNGIDDLGNRSDLLDRSILVSLEPIPPERRRDEMSINQGFEFMHGRILGALLDAVSVALNRMGSIDVPSLPRMADFAKWAIAAEPALLGHGSFMRAYSKNSALLHEAAIEANPVALGIVEYMRHRTVWQDTATRLLEALNMRFSSTHTKSPGWAKSARHLGTILNRVKPNLKHAGIELTTGVYHSSKREKHVRIATMQR